MKIGYFLFSLDFVFQVPHEACGSVKGKKVRTTSDDPGGKSVSEKSKSTVGKCVSENSTGENPGEVRSLTSNNRVEVSRSENP